MKKFAKFMGVIFVLLVLAVLFAPWKNLLEMQLKKEVAARGMENLEFAVQEVSLNEITFSDIKFGELKLPSLSISFSAGELLDGNFREIHAKEITIPKDKILVTLKDIDVSLVNQQWSVEKINIEGAPVAIPALKGKGTIKYVDNIIDLAGALESEDKKTKTSFELHYPTTDSKEAKLKIIYAQLPWSDGILATTNLNMPLYSDKPITLTLDVQKVSLNALLSVATSNRATATGVVSGTIPAVVGRDGSFYLKKGNLKADETGILKLSPDVIPSDAAQVALVRQVLEDFHYSVFSMGIESADNKQMVMLLSLEGNNPEVYNGRVVKLNVHLSGDVVELITQSLNILGQ